MRSRERGGLEEPGTTSRPARAARLRPPTPMLEEADSVDFTP